MTKRRLRMREKLAKQVQPKCKEPAMVNTLKVLALKDFSTYFKGFQEGPQAPLSQQQPDGSWVHPFDDGLGSV